MFFINTLDGINQRIQNVYYDGASYSDGYDRTRMLGLLFGRPESQILQREIIPSLNYFNERSAYAIDFFFGGYIPPKESEHNQYDDQQPVDGSAPTGHGYFSATAFTRLRQDIESVSTWKYSGAVDLILLTSRMSTQSRLKLDFSKTLVLNLQKCRESKLIPSIDQFFELVFRFAEEYDGNDPISSFSAALEKGVAVSAMAGGIKSFIPKILHKEIDRTALFAVKNRER